MFIQRMFTQGFLYNDLHISNETVLNKLQNIEYRNTERTRATGANCEISIERNILNFDEFKDLYQKINETVEFYIKNILMYNIDFKVYSSWATKTPPQIGFSHRHSHPNSWISGVYYPEQSEASLRFYTHNKSAWEIHAPQTHNEFNSDCFDVDIKKNRLIIFKSDLDHEIILNKENKPRYSIAFNILPFGKIGLGDSEIFLQ